MIRALITGTLFNEPQQRTSKAGTQYVTARISVTTEDGRLFASLVAFNEDAVVRLMQLRVGASLAVSGVLKVGVYTANNGHAYPNLDIVADEVAATTPRPKKPKSARRAGAAHDGSLPDGSDWLAA
ncbi:MAG: single-stranded DNA-binding protein [Methyloversatilis sp.]|nr:single-stranded DNA-binding protein [Methyloversatilis sp.]